MPSRRARGARLSPSARYPLERSIAHKLRLASRETMRALEHELALHVIPPGAWFFLRVLWEVPSIRQTELAERAGVMGPTTAAAMEQMARLGLITRRRLPDDRRKFEVRLTPRGRALREVLMPKAIAIVNAATEGLTADDVDTLHRLLDAVTRNLERHNGVAARLPGAQRRARRPARTASD